VAWKHAIPQVEPPPLSVGAAGTEFTLASTGVREADTQLVEDVLRACA
jgi:hypothetical protein